MGTGKHRAQQSLQPQQSVGVGGGWVGEAAEAAAINPVRCQCSHNAAVSHQHTKEVRG